MSSQPYLVETAILLLVAFVLGGALGFWARRWFPFRTSAADAAGTQPASDVAPEPAKDAEAPASEVPPAAGVEETGKPTLLSAPRQGIADDLQKISGIGPKIEKTLNEIGVYHFDQIAAWDEAALAWVDTRLAFHGRIARENWVGQAKALVRTE